MITLGDRFLKVELASLSNDEMIAFIADYQKYHAEAYRWDLWGAAYLINGGCSDDGFIDFRDWLVARGRAVYEAAILDPDSLADQISHAYEVDKDILWSAIFFVVEERFDNFPETIPNDDYVSSLLKEPKGEPFEEDERQLKQTYPRLAARTAKSWATLVWRKLAGA